MKNMQNCNEQSYTIFLLIKNNTQSDIPNSAKVRFLKSETKIKSQ